MWSLGLICVNYLIVMSGGGSLAEGGSFHEFLALDLDFNFGTSSLL